jgi:hypothetical protein
MADFLFGVPKGEAVSLEPFQFAIIGQGLIQNQGMLGEM